MEKKIKVLIKIFTISLIFILGIQSSFAQFKVNQIQFDPAIISAGDYVDIIVQYNNNLTSFSKDIKFGNPDYKFKVTLSPNDDLSKKYIRILDSQGDNLFGSVYSGFIYNKKFRIKVMPNAPVSIYQFKLIGRWYKNEVPLDFTREIKFFMNVKKDGINLQIPTINTLPSQVRSGDKFVEIKTFIENLGQKDSKSIKISLNSQNGISNSYSNNNVIFVGGLNAGQSRNISFFVNLDDNLSSGVYNLNYSINYQDIDNNNYFKNQNIDLFVKPKANLIILKSLNEGLAGDVGTLKFRVKNIGGESAENIDVRILKQNSQPFDFDIRSDYIGELKPNEEGVVIFNFNIHSDAKLKTHDFKLIIRAKGDTNQGDNTIYTFNRRAEFNVIGKAQNNYLIIGGVLFAILSFYLIIQKIRRNKK